MKGLCRRLWGVIHPERVIHGSGQVLYLSPNTKVEELLHYYPHHFLCQPGLENIYSNQIGNQMLALNTELQSGRIYFLFPLPRLFPTAPTLFSQSCTCFGYQTSSHSMWLGKEQPPNYYRILKSPSSLIFCDSSQGLHEELLSGSVTSRRWWWCLSFCSENSNLNSKSQVSPESDLYSAGRRDVNVRWPNPFHVSWRPRVGCISEDGDAHVCLEDVKQFCEKFWKRD